MRSWERNRRMIAVGYCVWTVLVAMAGSTARAWTCESSCGGVALNAPFGSGWECGDPSFQPYVNCSSKGKLLFYTPTGSYEVQAIDYTSNVMVVGDPHMSTCEAMQMSSSFGLPVGAPFAFASFTTVVLLGCSSTSSLYSKQSCDSSATDQQICSSLYSCPGISQLGISLSSSTSSCCVVSSNLLQTAPYEIDLPLLQCSSYSSIYRIGNVDTPQTSWSFGIALQFTPPSNSNYNNSNNNNNNYNNNNNGQHPSCYACEQAEESGDCGASKFRSDMLLKAWCFAGLSVLVAAFHMLLK